MSTHTDRLPEGEPLFKTTQEYNDWRYGKITELEGAASTTAQPPELGFVISRQEYPRHLKGFNQFGPIWSSSWQDGLVIRAEELTHLMSKLMKVTDGMKATIKDWPKTCQHRNQTHGITGLDYLVYTCDDCGKTI
jgi:hypothetical protein